ncbi:MAG: EAL domain-containing protein [Alphaproteobacteria bacterium]|nr:EAL domain-containing protein [Alphaproteobacteria bacterium]
MRPAIANFFRRILHFPGKILKVEEISMAQLPSSAANRMRQSQIRGAIEQMRVFLAGNTFFAPVMSFQAWNTGINSIVIVWTMMILTFSWWLFFRWNKSYTTNGSESDMASFVAETRVNAGLWCLGMILFYPHVSGNEKTILTTVMTGSLALGTVGFSQAPRAAFWYLGIQTTTLTLVPLVYGLRTGSVPDLVIAGLALLAGMAIFNAALERAKSQFKAFVNHESLLQKGEVIDLLLKDYEEQGVEWVWRTDSDGHILNCPQQVLELISDGDDNGARLVMLDALTTHVDQQGTSDLERVRAAFDARREFHNVTLPLYSASKGTLRWIMMRGRPQFDGNEFVGFRGIFADATTGVEAQKQVEYLAENDPLTGTLNRNFVQTHLEGLDPADDKLTAYLIDLDGFKQVNDSYGHTVGDQLLGQVAQRLKGMAGNTDIVARLGGDEFLILTEGNFAFEHLDDGALSVRLLARLSEPYQIDQYVVSLTASIGTANFPDDTACGPNLLNYADLALYSAKKGGRNKCIAFEQSMQDALQKRMVVTDRLRQAVGTDQIVPYYQPQYCARSLKLIGFEALARWKDPELGFVAPDVFIPIAEETGLIHAIGETLLLAACRDALTWTSSDETPLPTISVNLSPVQVMRGNVVKMVQSALRQTGLPPERLEIEVTEGVLIDDIAGTSEVLTILSQMGVKIALDDFGTGYSSLSYLRALPLDRVKIDRSFIADINDPEAQSIVQSIIDLCRHLNLEVVAEGVETKHNVETLRDMRCAVLQGYFFSRPVPASEIRQLSESPTQSAA